MPQGPAIHVRNRSLGQNFLTDDKILMEIAKTAAVRPGDLVLEITTVMKGLQDYNSNEGPS
eukprot:1140474-Pelagomonas_calceolata.AAC.1